MSSHLPLSQLTPPPRADATLAQDLKWKFVSGLIWAAFVFFLLAVVTGFAAATCSGFGSPMSNGSFAANLAPLLVILPAGVVIIASGGVDLSVGAVASLASVLFAFLLCEELPPAAAISLSLLCGLGVGLLNGMLVAFARVHSVIVTLGTMAAAWALAGLVAGGMMFSLPTAGFWEGLDSPAAWYAVVAASIVLGAVLVHLTPLCRRASAARRSGSLGGPAASGGRKTGRAMSVMALYTLSGMLAAACGLLVTVRLRCYGPAMWSWWKLPLEVIAAAVIGGTVFRSGFGNFGGGSWRPSS